MTDTNSTTLRNALAAAVKKHVDDNGLSAKQGAELSDVQLSRFYQVLRGEVTKISSDAIVNMLGNFGYRLTGIVGSGNGTEIVLSLEKAEKVLPEIEKPHPFAGYTIELSEDAAKVTGIKKMEIEQPSDFDPDFDRVVSNDE